MAAVRRSIQPSSEKLQALAWRRSINSKAVAKWHKGPTAAGASFGPKPTSTVLSAEHEAIAVAFRQHTLPPLDDCWYAIAVDFGDVGRAGQDGPARLTFGPNF